MIKALCKAVHEAKKNSIIVWGVVIAVNIIIAVTVISASINYFSTQINSRYEAAEQNFSSTLDTMRQVAYGYLHTEQTFCDNWATYINERKLSMQNAVDFARSVNTDSRVVTHIVYYDTLMGYCADNRYPETVSYKKLENSVSSSFELAKNCQLESSHLHITRPYVNPSSGVTCIGFCHNLNLVREDGTVEKAVLVRTLPISELQGRWAFPTGYNNARLSLIDGNGKFIVHFESGDDVNFFDYLEDNYDLTEADIDGVKNTFASSDKGNTRYVEKDGRETYYSYQRLEDNEEWMLIGCIAREDLNVTPVDLTIVVIVVFGFIMLMIFDGIYMIMINKRLRTSMEETKYANEAKTRFLSSMSHDIRTPMNAIIGMTTIAAKRIDDKKQVEECLGQISRASNHLLMLVNDILDISKVESGKLSMNPMVFSLAESIGNIVSIAQPHVKEKNMDFEVHAHNITHEYIYADDLRISQILINLISNAIKYTPEGGKVSFDLEERPSEKGNNMVRLIYTVADTGIGISEEFMKNMYNAFTRDVDNRINTIQGTGLGLAITKQMVEIMDGTIDVESELGKGTKFTVTLDLPIAEKMTNDLLLPPMRLLVADDDEIFLESAKETIKSLGVDVDVAVNGEEAVKMVDFHHHKGDDYHCVIIDWKMPKMDGLETIKAIRAKIGDNVPVIIISAYDWSEIEEEAMKAGANAFIAKPLFRSNVYDKLNELLNFDNSEKSMHEDEDEDLKGLNLLVAEDNDINWDIIQVMLDFQGIKCERAENGSICVDKISNAQEGTYDAILMDVQMPVMNGNDAARAIRASEKEYVSNIPIIAMTADAFAEDIVACKKAGMNGHVAKPIDMNKLLKELRSALRLQDRRNQI